MQYYLYYLRLYVQQLNMVLISDSFDVNHLRIWSEENPLLSCFSSDLGSLNKIRFSKSISNVSYLCKHILYWTFTVTIYMIYFKMCHLFTRTLYVILLKSLD